MDTTTLYALIGYLGSGFVVTSLAMRSILKLRLIGLAGAVTFVTYGYLIDAWPIVWTNVVILLIHLHFLREIRKADEYFKVLEVRRESHYLRYFLDHFANDIENVFAPIIDTLESGPRYLANTLETIRLCTAFVDLHQSTAAR